MTIVRIAAVSAALCVAASAGQAAAATRTENTLIGAAVGALAGALISNGDATATLAGAAVGGVVGSASDRPDRRRDGYAYSVPVRSYPTYEAGYRYVQPVPVRRVGHHDWDRRGYDRGYDPRFTGAPGHRPYGY